jgi:hypothetical protein
MPTPDVTIQVVETESHACGSQEPDHSACTAPAESTIWIVPGMSMNLAEQSFDHELGHNVDADLLPPWMRMRFMKIFGLAGDWFTEETPERWESPGEIFANVWAECAKLPYVRAARFYRAYGPIWQAWPTGGRERHNRACRMLAKL